VANLYSPPTREEIHVIKGSLCFRETISTTVWKISGQWHNAVEPAGDDWLGADWFFNTPTVVTDAVAAELTAFGLGVITII
jgi:hypothetical protein